MREGNHLVCSSEIVGIRVAISSRMNEDKLHIILRLQLTKFGSQDLRVFGVFEVTCTGGGANHHSTWFCNRAQSLRTVRFRRGYRTAPARHKTCQQEKRGN